MNLTNMQSLYTRSQKIKLVIFDVDGVLTDGRLYFGDDGQEYKTFHSRDGHGMKMLMQHHIEIGIITGRTSNVVIHRMNNLGVQHIYQGQLDKRPAYIALRDKLQLTDEQIAYVGDDVVDLPIMTQVGLAIAVADAHTLVQQHAHWITPHNGGMGAARDVCELILQAYGYYEKHMASYLQA